MSEYRTQYNDMVDAICYKFYGVSSKAVEIIYEANRGLADYGPLLPAGLIIELPDIELVTVTTVKLWD